MADDNSQLLSIPATPRALADELGASGLPPSLQILLDEGLYNRMKQLSMLMARAEGFTPKHLLGKGEACFAIINTALDWKLNPHFVARHTYQTPGGSIGFDGALVQSVLERSGRFIGSPEIEYHGDWEKLTGKFDRKTSQKGNEYVVPTWTATDALGLGIVIRWQVRGEKKPRAWPSENRPFYLTQCYPLNSPLWATDPKTQIAYLGIRRFANLAAPGILGAASFDYDEVIDASERARDVTPSPRRPRPEDYADAGSPASSEPVTEEDDNIEVVDVDGFVHACRSADDVEEAVEFLLVEIDKAARMGKARLEGLWESNQSAIEEIEKADRKLVEPVYTVFREALSSFDQKPERMEPQRDQPTPSIQGDGGELREGESPVGVGTDPAPLPTDAGGAPVARRRGRPPSTERRATQQQQETTSNSPGENPQAAPKLPPAEPAHPPSASASAGSTAPAASVETRGAGSADKSPTRSATGESPSSLAVPLVQKGQGQTDWAATAEHMVERVKRCTAIEEVKPLPFGLFRIQNRQSMDLMRTVDHDAWVSIEYALGQQMRQLQINSAKRNPPARGFDE